MTTIDPNMYSQPKTKNSEVNKNYPAAIWSNTTEEKLATVDVYDIQQSGTINSITKFANTFSTELSNIFTNGQEALQKISSGLKFYENIKNTINSGTGSDKLKAFNSLIPTNINGLPEDITKDLYSKIESTSEFLIKAGKTVNKIKNTDWKSLNSVMNLLKDISNGADGLYDLSDLNTQGQLLCSLVNQMSDLGIENSVEAIKPIIDKISKDEDDKHSNENLSAYVQKKLNNKLVNGTIDKCIATSNFNNINTLSSIAGSNYLTTIKNDLLNDVGRSYVNNKSTEDDFISNETKDYNSFVKMADNIYKNWYKTIRKDELIYDLSKINSGNEDFKNMIKNGALTDDKNERKPIIFIKELKNKNVKDTLMNDFPYTIWKDNNVTV